MNTARAFAVLALAFVTGLIGFQVGVSVTQNVAQNVAGQVVPVAPVPYGYYPLWHFGFGFIGLFFGLLVLFLFFGLLRAAVGGGHGMWHDRRARLEELHRELHERQSGTGERPT